MMGYFNASKQGNYLMKGVNSQNIERSGKNGAISYETLKQRAETNDKPVVFVEQINCGIANLDQYGLGTQGILQNVEMALHNIQKKQNGKGKKEDYYCDVVVTIKERLFEMKNVKVYEIVKGKLAKATLEKTLFKEIKKYIESEKEVKAEESKKKEQEELENIGYKQLYDKATKKCEQLEGKIREMNINKVNIQKEHDDEMDAMQRRYEGQLMVQKRNEKIYQDRLKTVQSLVDDYDYTFKEAYEEVFGVPFK